MCDMGVSTYAGANVHPHRDEQLLGGPVDRHARLRRAHHHPAGLGARLVAVDGRQHHHHAVHPEHKELDVELVVADRRIVPLANRDLVVVRELLGDLGGLLGDRPAVGRPRVHNPLVDFLFAGARLDRVVDGPVHLGVRPPEHGVVPRLEVGEPKLVLAVDGSNVAHAASSGLDGAEVAGPRRVLGEAPPVDGVVRRDADGPHEVVVSHLQGRPPYD